jgi:hypothetical protein
MDLAWKMFKDDGTTVDSSEVSEPEEVAGYGVICIVQPDEIVGREILEGFDFYYFADGRWTCGDLLGVLDRLLHRLEVRALCMGRTVTRSKYRAIHEAAHKDPAFPYRSGSYPDGEEGGGTVPRP